MKRISLLFCGLLSAVLLVAQKPTLEMKIWEGTNPPTENGYTEPEIDKGDHSTRVSIPTLTVYVPKNPCGLAILACPGGGYKDVWYGPEGKDMAQWYMNQGITYAVLKYRLPNRHREVPLDDVHQAMKIMRSKAQEWGFSKLGIQGCSAGGHLATTAATHFTSAENRPDFQVLFYPVVTMNPKYTHKGTFNNLLGENPSQELIDLYSNEKRVTKDTPPAFIMLSSDDKIVPVKNSLDYYAALLANGVSACMHIYPDGGHGWGYRETFKWKSYWKTELEEWLRNL